MRMNTPFAFLFFYSIIKLTIVDAASRDCKCTPYTSALHKFHNHVLRRRIRSVVFPSKAQLLLTPAFGKAVLDGRPRGLSYSVEFDMYSPLPDTIDGWKPTILMNKFKQQDILSQPLKTSTQTANISQNYNENFLEKQTYLEDYNYYYFPFHQAEDYYSNSNLEWTHKPAVFSSREFIKNSYKKPKNFQGFAGHFHKLPYLRKQYKRSRDFSDYTEKNQVHHGDQSDRERKQILKQLEIVGKIFNFNMKSCMQRAICELTSHFRSHGESVMEDIIRLLLVSPNSSHSHGRARHHCDNFNANYENVNCKQHFAVSCPYSILDF